MLQRVMSQIPVESFCLTLSRNFVWEPFCAVFQKFSVSEKVYGQEGEYQYFPLKIFRLTVPKNFVGEPFSVSLVPGIKKFYA